MPATRENTAIPDGGRRTGVLRSRGFVWRRLGVLLLLLIGLGGPLALSGWYLLGTQRESIRAGFRYEFDRMADVLANGMRAPIWNLWPESGRPILESVMRDKRVLSVRVSSVAQGDFLKRTRTAKSNGRRITLTRTIRHKGSKIGMASILIDASGMYARLDSQWRQMVLVGLTQLGLILAIVYFFFRVYGRLENEQVLRRWNLRLEREVKDRKRAEQELRESEGKFRAVIDNSPMTYMLKDLNGRIRLVNRTFENWTGQRMDAVLGRTSHDLYDREFANASDQRDARVLESKEALNYEHELTFADARVHTLAMTKFPVLDDSGKVIGIGSVGADVTEQREIEEKFRQAQKMEAVGQLTGGLAHDFNNLLAVVLGNLDLVEERLKDDGELKDLVTRAIGAAERGADLTQHLLAFSRRQMLKPQIVDLNGLIEGVTGLLRRTLQENIDIELKPAGDLWSCSADPAQLESALLNLAINARDAMPGGGSLTVATRNQTARENESQRDGERRAGDYVVLSVADDGHGMSEDSLKRAFEPFFSTKEVGKGSGLGLSMVYGFARQSGGYVTIDSTIGDGTCVEVYLPRAAATRTKTSAQAPCDDRVGATGESILLVEDNPQVRALAAKQLGSLGYAVSEAENGATAFEALKARQKFDLVLTDMVLPGGTSGTDIAKLVRDKFPDTGVVLMTGYADSAVPDGNGSRLPDTPTLFKPFRKAQLAEIVRKTIDGAA